MSRNKVNTSITEPMGKRLEELVTKHLQISWVDFSNQLGYTNSSTLHKIRNGAAAMTAEKLHDIAQIKFPEGRVNLNWLITGEGKPFRDHSEEPHVANINPNSLIKDEGALLIALMNILQHARKSIAAD